MNRPNRLQCLSSLVQCLRVKPAVYLSFVPSYTNAYTYAQESTREWSTFLLSLPANTYTRLGKLAKNIHSSLFGQYVSDEEKKFIAVFIFCPSLLFVSKVGVFQIEASLTLAGNTWWFWNALAYCTMLIMLSSYLH